MTKPSMTDDPYKNPIVMLAEEHMEMRWMIESLLHGLITPAAFLKKYAGFHCSIETEMYAANILQSAEWRAQQLKRRH